MTGKNLVRSLKKNYSKLLILIELILIQIVIIISGLILFNVFKHSTHYHTIYFIYLVGCGILGWRSGRLFCKFKYEDL